MTHPNRIPCSCEDMSGHESMVIDRAVFHIASMVAVSSKAVAATPRKGDTDMVQAWVMFRLNQDTPDRAHPLVYTATECPTQGGWTFSAYEPAEPTGEPREEGDPGVGALVVSVCGPDPKLISSCLNSSYQQMASFLGKQYAELPSPQLADAPTGSDLEARIRSQLAAISARVAKTFEARPDAQDKPDDAPPNVYH